jgi:hypothetical protein
MEKDHQDSTICPENEKGATETRDKVVGSVDRHSDSENSTNVRFWRHGMDNEHEKRILRKLDIHLLPLVSVLYLFSFL